MSEVVILDYTRTPIGSFNGSLSAVSVTKLGATVINGLINKVGINPESIDEVIMGNVLSANLGQVVILDGYDPLQCWQVQLFNTTVTITGAYSTCEECTSIG